MVPSMSRTSFTQRVAQLERKRRRPSSWFQRREGLSRPPIWRTALAKILLAFMAAGFGAKVLLFVALGEATYESRREGLVNGSEFERALAWTMQPDPVVRAIDDVVAALGF